MDQLSSQLHFCTKHVHVWTVNMCTSLWFCLSRQASSYYFSLAKIKSAVSTILLMVPCGKIEHMCPMHIWSFDSVLCHVLCYYLASSFPGTLHLQFLITCSIQKQSETVNDQKPRIEMALPVPTKSLLKTSPDAAMLFAPFGCTHPPPLSRPFCSRRT